MVEKFAQLQARDEFGHVKCAADAKCTLRQNRIRVNKDGSVRSVFREIVRAINATGFIIERSIPPGVTKS